jgi:hypothetical protein
MSSDIQRCKSASLQRSEQNGITADCGSGRKGLSHVGHRTVVLRVLISLENTRISDSSKRRSVFDPAELEFMEPKIVVGNIEFQLDELP